MLRLTTLALFSIAIAPAFCAEPAATDYVRDVLPLMQKYCHTCHGGQKTKAGVNFVQFKTTPDMLSDAKLWQTALRMVADKEMPPEDKPQPAANERELIWKWIEVSLKNSDATKLPKEPGRVTARRLSHLEYNNTLRDLLGVDAHYADAFPSDGSGGGGFDNNADTLFTSPLLMEKLLDAATDALDKMPDTRLSRSSSAASGQTRDAARGVLLYFATRAYRRPAASDELERLMKLFDAASTKGGAFYAAIRGAARAALVSPNFLYRIELDPADGAPHSLNDYEVASRLSYFLWSSMPDDELFDLAAAHKLQDPAVLSHQVGRMLADPKAAAFTENFCLQWLGIQNFKNAVPPDPRKFPTFTPSLRDAMVKETTTFFDAVMRQNGSLLDLLDCDYTFVNEELAKHYGLAGVSGPEFRRVKLADKNRGGLLCMASVLAFNSYPQRTSPVLRGKWVLTEMLGAPPPPPPPQVKVLPPDEKAKNGQTFRQSLEEHRKKTECAGCHARMDPIGFGLENFDPIGRWRTEIAGVPVDASGVLTSGEKFNGAVELKAALMKKKDDCVRNLAERMLAYALGRGLENYDAQAVKVIVDSVKKDDYKGATLVREIVLSYPFRFRHGEKRSVK